MPMELWGRETEEEDFIPEHRIRVFRRAGRDGGGNVVVWDRERRVAFEPEKVRYLDHQGVSRLPGFVV